MDSSIPALPDVNASLQDGQPIETLGSRRKRSRKACEPCRQRKRKCDSNDPCKTCVEFEYDCYYASPSKKRTFQGPHSPNEQAGSSTSPNQTHGQVSIIGSGVASAPYASDDKALAQQPATILDPYKVRFMSASSAVALPRLLGLELDKQNAPRLHAFGWHVGIRKENRLGIWSVVDLISLEDIRGLSKIYFDAVHPHLGFLEPDIFNEKCEARWSARGDSHFDAVICGVAALGSFFSGSNEGHPEEQTLVEFAKSTLVDAPVRCALTIDHVAALLLRAIYLRCTARPSGAWMATCDAMHFIEAVGLHRATPSITVVSPPPSSLAQQESDFRRRLAWMTFTLNTMFSYEYGRSGVYLLFNTHDPDATNDSVAFPHDLLRILKNIPADAGDSAETESRTASLNIALTRILSIPASTDARLLLKADMVFSIYRRLRLLRTVLSARHIASLIDLGHSALRAVQALIFQSRPWWMLTNTTFQLVCILLAIDTPHSLALVPEAIEVLESVSQRWSTHSNHEVTSTARLLVKMVRQRKENSLNALSGDSSSNPLDVTSSGDTTIRSEVEGSEGGTAHDEMTFLEWPDFSFNWDTLFGDESSRMYNEII